MVIHEINQCSLKELIHLQGLGVPLGGLGRPLSWAEGIAFIYTSLPTTDDIVRELLQGKIHWGGVSWALMPKYENVYVIKENNVKIPIINFSANPLLTEIAKEIKKTEKIH